MSVDRSRPPAPTGPPRPFRFPAFTRDRLANGLEVLVAPRDAVPLVDVRILLPAGGQEGGGRLAGLPSLHAALLDEGTAELDSIGIARRVEGLGGSLGSSADWDVAWVRAATLADHADDALDLMGAIVRTPSFPKRELERLRNQWLAELDRRRSQPSELAASAFARAVYGPAPYGGRLIGSIRDLPRIAREDVAAFHADRVLPRGSTVIVVGSIDRDRALRAVEAAFGDWADPGRPGSVELAVPPPGTLRAIVVDRPNAPQTQLQLGHASVPREHPDVPALLVLNGVLGGKFTSRLNLVLREELGVTYGVRSRFDFRRGPGPFTITAAVDSGSVGRCLHECLRELERLRDEPVPEAELRETRDYLVGTFPYTLQTLGGISLRLETLVVHGLPDDTYETYPALLRDVDADEVRRAAARHLHPRAAAVVAVGPAGELAPQLEELMPVEVVRPDDLF